MKKVFQKGFTLIELLIVIGILAILVVTVLITLNPAEAQKKTRDAKRMKDMATIQSIIEQYINDGNAPVCTAAAGCTSSAAGQVQSQSCSSNWIGVDLCKYANSIPVDPANTATRTYVNGGTVAAPTTTTGAMLYQLKMSGGDYEINVRQESTGNANNVVNDGGDDADWAETGSDPGLDLL